MAKKIDFKKLFPYLVALLVFVIVTISFFSPLLEGKVLSQGDIKNHRGMSKEIMDFRKANNGEEPLWTNSMFGGMPAYQISVSHDTNFLNYIDTFIRKSFPHPSGYLFIYMLGFFILLQALKVDPWLSIVGALAFAFSSYFLIIIEAGHNSKAHAIGYMAPVLASVILTLRGKRILGGIMMALFMGLELKTNHPQITYYLGLIVLSIGIFELIDALKQKRIIDFSKSIAVLMVATLLAFSANITTYWTTAEYSSETIRGKSELTFDKHDKTSGLDRSYATQWSYGKSESFSLMIPNIKGGVSEAILANEKAMESISNSRPILQKIYEERMTSYFGEQPFTSGPVYIGALIVFLFILGLFVVKGKYKWALLTVTLLSLFLSWGKNMMWFTDIFMDYFPAYNKFRAVSMTLVIAELTMVLLAFLGLKEIVEKPSILKEKKTQFFIALGLTGGLSLLFALMPQTFFSFTTNAEAQKLAYFQQATPGAAIDYQTALNEVIKGRVALFTSDAWRSFAFIFMGAGILFLFGYKKINKHLVVAVIGILILADLIPVNRRYLNDDDYVVSKRKAFEYFPSQADRQILQDRSPNYRVFNLSSGNPFSDASTSYFHHSIGGYHGAKLRRYQDIIDHHLMHQDMNVLNMLNTKYFIVPDRQSQQPMAQLNRGAMGNAWFVQEPYMVSSPDQEIMHLGTVIELKLIDKSNVMKVYGRDILPTDTLLQTAIIELDNAIEDLPNANLYLAGYQLIPGLEYTFGNNPNDTSANFIDLSEADRDKLLKAKHFTVKVIYQFNPRRNAIIDTRFESYLSNYKAPTTQNGSIQLTSYKPNHLIYKAKTDQDRLAVFSEIYYDKGWNAYIDNKKVEHIRANYILRSMIVPKGEHTIEFKFEPKSYKTGSVINAIGSSIIILLVIGGAVFYFMKQRKE